MTGNVYELNEAQIPDRIFIDDRQRAVDKKLRLGDGEIDTFSDKNYSIDRNLSYLIILLPSV
jgi:hypothetical protein